MIRIDLRPVTVYALTDPDTGVVRYVGQTLSLSTRYAGHIGTGWNNPPDKRAWVTELRAQGKIPGLRVLATCSRITGDAEEHRWIEHFKSEGADLLNGGLYRHGHYSTRKGKRGPRQTPVYLSLTPETRSLLKQLGESRGMSAPMCLETLIRAEGKRVGLTTMPELTDLRARLAALEARNGK